MKLDELKKIAGTLSDPRAPDAKEQMYALLLSLGQELGNIYQELEMGSRYVDTHRDTSFSNAQMQLHSHTFYELLYCCSSGGTEYLVGSERYRLQRGDIIFVPPGISHRPLLSSCSDEPYSRYVLWLSQDFLEFYAGLFPYLFSKNLSRVGLLRTAGTKWEQLGELFRRGVEEAEERRDGWQAAVLGNTVTLLTRIKRATDERSVHPLKSENPELLDRITAFIEENYARRFTISELAAKLYVSSSTVSHLFKQKMGVSFYRYVTQRRLIAAKPLIESGMPLEDVCLQVGFADYSGFYRAFKQEYGISPRQYRSLQDGGRK